MTRIGTGLAEDPAEAAAAAAAELGDERADLAWLFLSTEGGIPAEEAVAAVHDELHPRHLVGCVAEGVVGRETEVEAGTAAAVWAASLPEVDVGSFQVAAVEGDEGIVVLGFPEARRGDLVMLVVDPYTFPADAFLEQLNEDHPGMPIVGGIATGRRLILGREVLTEGAVGAVVRGAPVRLLVSQGCAPVGRDAVVTAAE
jgi:small ligand-binding sensory domain FIST